MSAKEEAEQAMDKIETYAREQHVSADGAFRDLRKDLNLSTEAEQIVRERVKQLDAEARKLDEEQRQRGE